jgi:Tfp pilus assembly protein PilO
MPQEKLDLLRLQKPIRDEMNDLLRALNAASTREDLEAERALQIESIQTLESTRKLRSADAEALYIIFDDAVEARLENLP